MSRYTLTLLGLLLASLASAQPPPDYPPAVPLSLPPQVPMPAVTTSKAPPLDYTVGAAQAVRDGRPLVTFVGCTPRAIVGAVMCYSPTLPGYVAPTVVIAVPGEGWIVWHATLSATATDAQIQAAFAPKTKAVQAPSPSPFSPKLNQLFREAEQLLEEQKRQRKLSSADDKGPWLPVREQTRIRNMLPKGVPVPDTLKFYSLVQVYQSLSTTNNGRTEIRDILPIRRRPDPWRTSGGMHHVDPSEWRNVTGLAIPVGESIKIWEEPTNVQAYALVRRWRWAFPVGTIAYDVLLRTDGEDERVFEVRTHERLTDGWDDGTTYRPRVQVGDAKATYGWSFSEAGLNAVTTAYTVDAIPEGVQFVPTKVVAVDGKLTPPGYVGAGIRCAACHSRPAAVYNVPGAIYREVERGDDGRYSWHPFDAVGGIDTRWPLERK